MLKEVQLEIFKNLFSAIAEEMGKALERAAYSPNIKERKDFSCALFSPAGELVAQAAHIPVHLGSMPLSVQAAIDRCGSDLAPGDLIILNDPYQGGTHLPDLTAVTPVFTGQELVGFAANRAHHADIGGAAPGSMSLVSEIFAEGLRIPPVKLYRGGRLDRDLLDWLLANVRVPRERRGDLAAQLAANRRGAERFAELIAARGLPQVRRAMDDLLAYGERLARQAIAALPDGRYTSTDALDDDGLGHGPIPIEAAVTIAGDRAIIDFTGTAAQVAGPVNCVRAVTLSAAAYVLRCLMGPGAPTNGGLWRAFDLIAPEGSLVAAQFPAAVAAGNVETSQRLVDVLLGALAQAAPDRIPAAACGSMNNVVIGGYDPRRGENFAYYETVAGGMGGSARGMGLSGVQTHMTNTQNTPVEALEHAYPLRVRRYALRTGSGGAGRAAPPGRGGDGLVREIEALVPCRATLLTERRRLRPWGLHGGEAGAAGENAVLRPTGGDGPGAETPLPPKVSLDLAPGDVLIVRTPGGGGYGRS